MLTTVLAVPLLCATCPAAVMVQEAPDATSPRIATLERTIPDIYAPGDEAHWVFAQKDTTIGRCWSRYEGEVDLAGVRAHRFRGQVHLDLELPQGRFEQHLITDLWADPLGHPLRCVLETRMSDVYAYVDVTFGGGTAQALVRQGPTERTVEKEVPADAYLLANNFISHLELLLNLRAPAEGEPLTVQMYAVNALTTIPFTVTYQEAFAAGGGVIYGDSLGEQLHRADDGRLVQVDVPAQGITITRVDEPYEPFVIEVPALARRETPEFDRDEVTIEQGDARLAGLITRPKGSEGALPAVFFISGSGMQDRDGYSSGLDVGTHELLDRLTAEGFLVLRVDDRGAGASEAPLDDMPYDDLVADARACVHLLRQREDVDASRVALIGHSEGGLTALILAGEMPELAAIVLMASPGRPVLELMREQLLRAKRQEGATPEELEAYAESMDAFIAQVATDEPIDTGQLPRELQLFLPMRAWMRSHAQQDPIEHVAGVRCPVLIVQGDRDIQVSTERDARPLLAALETAGHDDHELIVFPELDHLFKKTIGEESSGLDYLKSRPVDPAFLDAVSAWLKERLALEP
jgi:pimeloyl-ACP methyl ester carboxylesterase